MALLGGLALCALGCGGGTSPGGADGGGCAPSFRPCGGDVVGTWRAVPTCNPVQPTHSLNGCQGETFDLTGVVSTVTWTFGEDHSFTITTSAQGSATVSAPTACLIGTTGLPLDCDDAGAGAMYAARIAFTGGKAGAPTCTAAADACQCTIPFVSAPAISNNTYSTSGTTLTVIQSGGSNPLDYCVSGNTLDAHVRIVAGTAGDVDLVRQ